MLAPVVISAIVLTPLISAILRLRGAAKVPAFLWFTLIAAAAAPAAVGWIILNPKAPVATEYIEETVRQKALDSNEPYAIRLSVPEKHSLMLTALLAEDVDLTDPKAYKTDYSLKINGIQGKTTWKKTLTGTFEREAENKSEVEVESFQGKEISKNGRQRDSAGFSENIQDRYELPKHGDIKIEVQNFSGLAADGIKIDVIPSPPSQALLWGIALILSLLGIYFEAWKNCDKVAGDVGFMAMYAVFLADGVTPLDGIKGIGLAALAAFFLAYAAVAGIAYLFSKYNAAKGATP